jgi:hypothetical protein
MALKYFIGFALTLSPQLIGMFNYGFGAEARAAPPWKNSRAFLSYREL